MPIILSLHLGPTTCADVSFLLLRSCLDPTLLIIFYSMPCVPAVAKMLRLARLTVYAAAMNTLANHGYISRKYGVLLCSYRDLIDPISKWNHQFCGNHSRYRR